MERATLPDGGVAPSSRLCSGGVGWGRVVRAFVAMRRRALSPARAAGRAASTAAWITSHESAGPHLHVEPSSGGNVQRGEVEVGISMTSEGGAPRTSAVAAARLHEACLAAARHYARGPLVFDATSADVVALDRAVRAYVTLCRSEGLPPEQALVRVKAVIRACVPQIGQARSELALREAVLVTFLDAYFPDGRMRSRPAGASAPTSALTPLSSRQWSTLGGMG